MIKKIINFIKKNKFYIIAALVILYYFRNTIIYQITDIADIISDKINPPKFVAKPSDIEVRGNRTIEPAIREPEMADATMFKASSIHNAKVANVDAKLEDIINDVHK